MRRSPALVMVGVLAACRSPMRETGMGDAPIGAADSAVVPTDSAGDPTLPADPGRPDALPFVPDMVPIPAGTFEMGCAQGLTSDWCYPAHSVALTHDYLIGRTEITIAQFRAVMGYLTPGKEVPAEDAVGDDTPAEAVLWDEAAAFSNAVSKAEGLSLCYACSGEGRAIACEEAMDPYACPAYRLPTEAEWENAARCGKDYVYAGSDDSLLVAWTEENSELPDHVHTTKPVATLAPNDCGTYDMSGNVFELLHEFFGSYTADAQTDPNPSETWTPWHGARGGDAYYYPACAEVTYRGWSTDSDPPYGVGFRLARVIPEADTGATSE